MAQTHRHTHGHGDSMTHSAQWGRVGENQFELIFYVRLSETYTFNFFIAKPLRKKIGGQIWIFVEVIFNFSSEIGFFELTWRVAAVTLHFEDLAVQNYFLKKDVCIRW